MRESDVRGRRRRGIEQRMEAILAEMKGLNERLSHIYAGTLRQNTTEDEQRMPSDRLLDISQRSDDLNNEYIRLEKERDAILKEEKQDGDL